MIAQVTEGSEIHRFRRWSRYLLILIITALILTVVASGLFRAVMLVAPSYRQDLASWVSGLAGQPVEVGAMNLIWKGWKPNLSLESLVLRDAENGEVLIQLEQANLAFSPLDMVTGALKPASIELVSPSLVIERDEQGKIGVRGIDRSASNGQVLDGDAADAMAADPGALLTAIRAVGNLSIREGSVRWIDRQSGSDPIQLTGLQLALDHQSSSSQAMLSIILPEQLGSEVSASLNISGDLSRFENWSVRGQLDIDTLVPWSVIEPWLNPGVAMSGALHDIALQLDYGEQRLRSLRAAMSMAATDGYIDGERRQIWRSARAELEVLQRADDWRVEIADLSIVTQHRKWPRNTGSITWVPDVGTGSGAQLELAFLGLEEWTNWLPVFRLPESTEKIVAQLINYEPHGALSQLKATWRESEAGPVWSLASEFDDLGWEAVEKIPGVRGLSGYLQADESGGELALTSVQKAVLKAPDLFDETLKFDQLRGVLAWQLGDGFWSLKTEQLKLDLLGLQTVTRLGLQKTEDAPSPDLDLKIEVNTEDATKLKPLLPNTWSQNLRNWFGYAIRQAAVPEGEIVVRGPTHLIPFRKGEGEYRIDLQVRGAELEYARGWPLVENIDARVLVDRQTLSVEAFNADTLGTSVAPVTAVIPDLGLEKGKKVVVAGKINGNAKQLIRFLPESPLRERYSAVTETLSPKGPVTGDLDLTFFFDRPEATTFDLRLGLHGLDIGIAGLDDPFSEIIGPLQIDNAGLRSSGLRAVFVGQPVSATLGPVEGLVDAETDNSGAIWTQLSASSRGVFSTDETGLMRYLPTWLRPYLGGQTDVRAEMYFGAEAPPGVFLESDLRGVLVALPAPLGKPADEQRAVSLHLLPGNKALDIRLDYGDEFSGRYALSNAGSKAERSQPEKALRLRSAEMRLGMASEMPVPAEDVIRLSGKLPEARFEQWQPIIRHVTSDNDQEQAGRLNFAADLSVGELWAFGQQFPQQNLNVAVDQNGWQIGLDGRDAKGMLSAPSVTSEYERMAVLAELESLQWDPPARVNEGTAATGPAVVDVDPVSLPSLNMQVQNFILADQSAGQLVLQAEAISEGIVLKNFTLSGNSALTASATGEWRRTAGLSRASLSGTLNSDDFASALDRLRYEPNVLAKEAQISANLQWLPNVAGIDLPQTEGAVRIDLKDGTLQAIDPGAGRMLGLFSVSALPRRLFLDFSDVTKKGMAFDDVQGDFVLGGGNAKTQNLTVKSPSVRIESRGRVGLAARDYDQDITIYPDASSGLTVAGAVLGGPAAGVILLLAQELLDKPMDQATQISYRLTGPWSDPVIERSK